MKIRHFIIFTFVVFVFYSLGFGGAVLKDFRAEPGLNQVELKWIVTAESGLRGYRIQRSMDGATYQKIGFVAAEGVESGDKTYKFVDKSVFKSDGRTFHYQIQFVNQDGSVDDYEKTVAVTPQISSTRHTWGSLKAMFR